MQICKTNLFFYISNIFSQETEKKRKIEKMKQKRWQEKHRQFMFGTTDDNEREGIVDPDNDTFLGPPLKLNDRPLSRPPSIVSLQSRRRTDSAGDTPSRNVRRESEVGLSHFLTSKLLKEKKRASMKGDETPSVSDSDAGSIEGSYDVLMREPTLHDSPPSEFVSPRDRALSVPMIVTPSRLLAETSRDNIEEEDDDDQTEYSTRL